MRPNVGPTGNNTLGENPGTSGKSRSLHRRKEKLWKGAEGLERPSTPTRLPVGTSTSRAALEQSPRSLSLRPRLLPPAS